jgi:hypothetical protein
MMVRGKMMAGKKSGKMKGCRVNLIVAGIDLGDRKSLGTVLSLVGDSIWVLLKRPIDGCQFLFKPC